jgi:carboxypeptidase Q
MHKLKVGVSASVILCVAALPLTAQAPNLSDVYTQIRMEETNSSKIMWIIHEIADVYGPRLTGTPNLKAADDWAVKTMTSWGLVNAHLEPWTFQPPSADKPVPGWENMELSAVAVSPFHGSMMVQPLAWTPSTKGVVTAKVVMIEPPGLTPPAGGSFGAPAPGPAAAHERHSAADARGARSYNPSPADTSRTGRISEFGQAPG